MGFIPETPQILGLGTGFELLKDSGTLWGQGKLKFWGFLWGNPQKSPNFGVGSGDKISGIFPPLVFAQNIQSY